MDRLAYEWEVRGAQSQHKLAAAGSKQAAEAPHHNHFHFALLSVWAQTQFPAVWPYPRCVVDPEYSADDVLLQVGRDKLHLNWPVAVDSVFRPVLWAQLNKTRTDTHNMHTHTHRSDTHTHIDEAHENTQDTDRIKKFISFTVSCSMVFIHCRQNWLKLDFFFSTHVAHNRFFNKTHNTFLCDPDLEPEQTHH